jgi:DegV family protein with EDD domain
MPKVCILTDGTAQFTHSNFLGHEQVVIIPHGLRAVQPKEIGIPAINDEYLQQLIPPSQDEFIRYFSKLNRDFDYIFVLTLSSQLAPVNRFALSASKQYGNHGNIIVIDSLTTGIGLGLLVQYAAAELANGISSANLERKIRVFLPRIYMLCCVPDLQVLSLAGFMQHSQALVGEMISILPIFSIEDGRLTLVEKARTQRHLFETYLEFMDEFDSPAYISLMRGVSQGHLRTQPLRQHIRENFPKTPFSEHTINPQLTALLGPHSSGLVILDSEKLRS